MRKKDNMGAQLKELDIVIPPPDVKVSPPPLFSKGKTVRRDEPGKKQHNESEKCRRNLMKHDLERLRAVVPMDEDVQKQTTMGLLHKARVLIRNLETKDRKHSKIKADLIREQKYLKRRLEQLQHLIAGGAISLGNTLLLAVPPPPQEVPAIPPPPPVAVPHILKRKQVLLTSNSDRQLVITDVRTLTIQQPDNMCNMIDEMEHLAGVTYFGAPPPIVQEYLDEEEEAESVVVVDQIIETETVDNVHLTQAGDSICVL